MSYEPTVWKSGDVITSAKLNKIENGIASNSSGSSSGNGVAIFHASKVWDDNANDWLITVTESVPSIFAAIEAGALVAMDIDCGNYVHRMHFISDYEIPSSDYDGYLCFNDIGYLDSASNVQEFFKKNMLEWYENEWHYKEYIESFVHN